MTGPQGPTAPTPALLAQINAAPEPLRSYVHDLATRYDPAGQLQELYARREQVEALTAGRGPGARAAGANAAREAERERDFDEMENDPSGWGWDGQHLEDAVAYARMFRRQRDEARAGAAHG